MEKNPYLVDVAVRLNVWIRPESQRKQFEVIKQARPSTLFLISDGGRNEKEWEAIRENRAMFENEIDWECTVYKIFEEKNNGLYTMSRKGAELIWSKVDRCIFLEDDSIPSVCYFKYAAELLEKYKDDERILCICSMNQAGVWDKTDCDYFFSKRGPICGQALWKRSYEQRDIELNYAKDPYVMSLLRKQLKNNANFLKSVEGYAQNSTFGGHVPGGEFLTRLNVYTQNGLYIIPKYNMMCNVGCTENSEHASEYKLLPRGIRKMFHMEAHEYEFPLKHPKYVIADDDYMEFEERLHCHNRPVARFFRKVESFFLYLRYKGLAGAIKRVKRKFKKRIER